MALEWLIPAANPSMHRHQFYGGRPRHNLVMRYLQLAVNVMVPTISYNLTTLVSSCDETTTSTCGPTTICVRILLRKYLLR